MKWPSIRWTQKRKQLATAVASFLLVAIPMFWFASVLRDQRPNRDITASGDLLGVDPNHFTYATQAFQSYPQSFSVGDNQENERKDARIWKLTVNVNMPGKRAGEHFGCGPQETGDCVSWGSARCVSECLASQIALGKSSGGGVVFQPHLYGVARRDGDQKGFGEIPCRSSGAIPSLSALNFDEFGLIFYHEVEADGVRYSGSLADEWGCKGVPAKWLALGKRRAGGETYPVRSVEELRDAICNGYPCTYAGAFTPGRKYTKDNRNCLEWNGRHLGYHQMCVIGYDGSAGRGREYFYVQNSHGPNAQAAATPMNDEPPGGFWVSMATMQNMFKSNGEFWAFSAVAGFAPQDIDWSAFDQFRAAPPQQEQEQNNEVKDRRAAADRSRVLAL